MFIIITPPLDPIDPSEKTCGASSSSKYIGNRARKSGRIKTSAKSSTRPCVTHYRPLSWGQNPHLPNPKRSRLRGQGAAWPPLLMPFRGRFPCYSSSGHLESLIVVKPRGEPVLRKPSACNQLLGNHRHPLRITERRADLCRRGKTEGAYGGGLRVLALTEQVFGRLATPATLTLGRFHVRHPGAV